MRFFCIGAFLSGSASTREYLESLGLNTIDRSVIACNYKNYPHDMGPIDNSLEEFDVFGDIPYNYMDFIERMIHEYPDALFFLSTRDESGWLSSVKRHRATHIEGVSNLITESTLKHVGIEGSSDDELKASYLARNTRVSKLFERANSGNRLCAFSIEDSSMRRTIDNFLIGHGFVLSKGEESFSLGGENKVDL